jgi:hypothetical protein
MPAISARRAAVQGQRTRRPADVWLCPLSVPAARLELEGSEFEKAYDVFADAADNGALKVAQTRQERDERW